MSYTVEEIVDAIWAYAPRTVDGGSPASPISYLDSIVYDVWTYSTRTVESGSGNDVISIGDTELPELASDSFILSQLHNLSIADTALPSPETDVFVLNITTLLSFGDTEIGSLLAEAVGISQLHMLGLSDTEIQNIVSTFTTITEDDGMAVTSASSGNVYRLTAANDTIPGKIMIRKIRWVAATTAAHVLELRCGAAGANDVVLSDICAAANNVKEIDFIDKPLSVSDLKVQTLGSGVVYVYVA